MKPKFLFQIDLSSFINSGTFSVVPSSINETVKKIAVPLDKFVLFSKTRVPCLHIQRQEWSQSLWFGIVASFKGLSYLKKAHFNAVKKIERKGYREMGEGKKERVGVGR